MAITISHTFLPVADQDEALAFYRDVMGLEVRTDVTMEGFRWLTVGSPEQPGLELNLEAVGMGKPETDHDTLRALMAKGSLATLIFMSDDVDATFEKVRAAGTGVMQEPIDQPYGVRDCAFRDPSGNHIRISQLPKE
jgi:catechol 2,3-dioxygenase-like lactoylglutathione lyase family enzyme